MDNLRYILGVSILKEEVILKQLRLVKMAKDGCANGGS
jgi:hypothetical protein